MNTEIHKNSDEVVDLVFEAILKNRLKPGVRLSEISLNDILVSLPLITVNALVDNRNTR